MKNKAFIIVAILFYTGDAYSQQKPEEFTITLEPTSVKYQNPDPKSPIVDMLGGAISVDGKKYKVYLRAKGPYSLKNTKKEGMDIFLFNDAATVTVDYDQNGKLGANEVYTADYPLRFGQKMFSVKSIAADGKKMVLEESKLPLAGLTVGDAAPDFSFKDLDGKVHTLKDYKGKFLLFNVWSVTCGSCIEFMPQILALQKEVGEDKLAVVMLSVDNSYGFPDAEKRNIDTKNRIKMPWPNVLVPGGWNELLSKFKIQGYGDYLIDPNGKVLVTGPGQHIIDPLRIALGQLKASSVQRNEEASQNK